MILVSACLCGLKCRYDGQSNTIEEIVELLNKGEVIPVCPEQLAGLTTPRLPVEIVNGEGKDVLCGNAKVVSKDNDTDCTDKFIKGAQRTLEIAKALNIKKAILKQKSPSCGYGQIYDGTFKGKLINGNGVTAQLLHDNSIEICDENNYR